MKLVFNIFLLSILLVGVLSEKAPDNILIDEVEREEELPSWIDPKDLKEIPVTFGEDKESNLTESERFPGKYLRGGFLLCEGYNPFATNAVSYSTSVTFTIVYGTGCTLNRISGRLSNGVTKLNHASLWASGAFTGLNYIYEYGFVCSNRNTAFVALRRTSNGFSSYVARCGSTYEAHVFTYRI